MTAGTNGYVPSLKGRLRLPRPDFRPPGKVSSSVRRSFGLCRRSGLCFTERNSPLCAEFAPFFRKNTDGQSGIPERTNGLFAAIRRDRGPFGMPTKGQRNLRAGGRVCCHRRTTFPRRLPRAAVVSGFPLSASGASRLSTIPAACCSRTSAFRILHHAAESKDPPA